MASTNPSSRKEPSSSRLVKVSDFDYELPASSIAQSAVEPRHASRLLDARDLVDHSFLELPSLLDDNDLIVVNETKVRAARLLGHRVDSGGQVEILLLERIGEAWEALARPSRRLRKGVRIDCDGVVLSVIRDPIEGVVQLVFESDEEERLIDSIGEIPLPPYFTGHLEDPGRYQTVFANRTGSAAAPTAGLHFTREVVDALRQAHIAVARVDLHVSLDTFRPMSVENLDDHQMHTEWCRLPEETARAIADTRKRGGRVIAIGTTVLRTLESFATGDGLVDPGETKTSLFLRPGIPIRVAELMVTNFHLPRASLLVLLAAFMGDRWREVYGEALSRGYRFLSFGDAMLAQRQDLA